MRVVATSLPSGALAGGGCTVTCNVQGAVRGAKCTVQGAGPTVRASSASEPRETEPGIGPRRVRALGGPAGRSPPDQRDSIAPVQSPTVTAPPDPAVSRRTMASAMMRPMRGENAALVMSPPTSFKAPPALHRLRCGAESTPFCRFVEDDADEPARNASATAMQHADDHFLADVAALRQCDRARLEARLERDRLRRHVDAEAG